MIKMNLSLIIIFTLFVSGCQSTAPKVKNVETKKSSFQKRSQHPLLDSKRARVIPAGYIILKEIMNYKNFNNVLVCERGLRWGALL